MRGVQRTMARAQTWVSQAPLGRTLQITGVVVVIIGISLAVYFLSKTPRATDFSPHFKRPLKGGIKQGIWGPDEARQLGLSKEWDAYRSAYDKVATPGLASASIGMYGAGGVFLLGLVLEERKGKQDWKKVQERMEERLTDSE